MKKIFYIVLVIVILFAIGFFVKQQAPQQPQAQIDVEEVIAAEVVETPAVDEVAAPAAEDMNDGEIVGEAPVADVEAVANETISEVAPEADNDGAEEVEEVDPGQTADEDETIVKE